MSNFRWLTRLAASVAGAGLMLGVAVSTAHADYQHLDSKPEFKMADNSNVDLISGQFSLSITDVGIGGGPGALTHTIFGNGNRLWPDSDDNFTVPLLPDTAPIISNLVAGGNTCDTAPYDSLVIKSMGSSERFCVRNGAFVSASNHGGTLTYTSGHLLYTDKGGVSYQNVTDNGVTHPKITFPNGVVYNIYSTSTSEMVISSTGYQLFYQFDPTTHHRSSVTAFNSSVDYCAPLATSCSFSKSWPTAHYTVTSVNGSDGGTYGTTDFDVTFQDQYNRITRAVKTPGLTQITTPESSISGNYTYTFCDFMGTNYTDACNANMGMNVIAYNKLGYVVNSTHDGAQTNYSWVIGGVPYTTTGTASPPSGAGQYRHTVAGCNSPKNWDPCYDLFVLGDGERVSYDQLNHSTMTGIVYDGGMQDAFTFDSRGNKTQTVRTPASGSGLSAITTSSNYDSTCSNLVTCNQPNYTVDANGNRTDYTYDPVHGGVLTVTGPADAFGVRPQTRNTYTLLYPQVKNSSGTLVASSGVWMLTRSSTCMTATAANPAACVGTDNEVVTTYAYASNNLLLTSKTVMSGSPTTDVNQPYSSTNLWQTTTYAYDDVGNLISEDGPLAGTVDKTVYRYNSLNQKIGVVGPDPDGAGSLPRPATRTTYNAAGQVTLVETGTMAGQAESDWANFAPLSQVATFYDSYGRTAMIKTSEGGVLASVVQTSYEPTTGRVSCVATRMNLSLSFAVTDDACSLKTPSSTSFGPDRIVKNTYDALDHVTKVEKGYGTALVQAYATYTYTNLGLKTSETDANGNKSILSYDGLDRLVQITYPSTTAGSGVSDSNNYDWYTYDANGNRTGWRRRDGRWIYYAYDHLDRVVQTNVSDGSVPYLFSDYDLLGRPCITAYTTDIHTQGPDCTSLFTSQTASGLHYKYNALGQLLAVKDSNNRTMSYLYNQASARTRLTYPDSNYVTSDLDNLNRLIDAKWGGSTQLFAQTYNPLGLRATLSRGATGEGGSSTYTWDNLGRLTHLTNDLSGTSTDVTWNFVDSGGNPAYSPAGQLTGWNSTSTVYDFADSGSPTESHTYDGLNRDAGIVVVNGNTGYDANGNVHNDGARYMVYDIYNRLVSVASSPTAQPYLMLAYDPAGRLASSTYNGVMSTYLYDGTNLIAEYDSTNAMIRRYVHGSGVDEPLVWFEGPGTGAKSYFYQDYHGSVIAVANSNGAIDPAGYPLTAIYKYGPYGEPLVATNPSNWSQTTKTFLGARFRYTGQATIPEANLYYYKAREYDPYWGRFLQTDPIGTKADLDLYAYVGDDPVDRSDPSGLQPGDQFSTPDAAAKDALRSINPQSIAQNREYGGSVDRVVTTVTENGKTKTILSYVASQPVEGSGHDADIAVNTKTTVAIYHTHGDWSKPGPGPDGGDNPVRTTRSQDRYESNKFSQGPGNDTDTAAYSASLTSASRAIYGETFKSWLGTPSGAIKSYTPPQ